MCRPSGTTFLLDCDGISGIHGPCFTADNVYTPGGFVSYYFGCGDECMAMPFKATEAFIKTALLDSVVTAVNAISIGEWGNTSVQFDLTLDVRWLGGYHRDSNAMPARRRAASRDSAVRGGGSSLPFLPTPFKPFWARFNCTIVSIATMLFTRRCCECDVAACPHRH